MKRRGGVSQASSHVESQGGALGVLSQGLGRGCAFAAALPVLTTKTFEFATAGKCKTPDTRNRFADSTDRAAVLIASGIVLEHLQLQAQPMT